MTTKLIGLAIAVLFATTGNLCGQVRQGQENMLRFFNTMEVAIKSQKIESMIATIDRVNVDSLLPDSSKLSPRNKEAKCFFLAYAEDAFLVPGVPVELETKVIKQKMFLEIPGTGDDSKISNKHLRDRWFETVSNFALRYNCRLYRKMVEKNMVEALPRSENEVRSILHIDLKTWQALPVEVQVTLEIFVNQQASRQDKLDKLPTIPNHRHSGNEK